MMNHCFRLRFGLQPTAASIARAKNNYVKTQAYSFNIPSPQIRHKTSSHLLGRNRSPETGACDWQPQQIVSPECDRHSFGFLLCLSSASSCQRRTPSGSPPRFYQHISGGHRRQPESGDRNLIVSLDPFGGLVSEIYTSFFQQGYDIRPTIAVTKAHINMPELQDAIASGRVQIDGKIVKAGGNLAVTKIAISTRCGICRELLGGSAPKKAFFAVSCLRKQAECSRT